MQEQQRLVQKSSSRSVPKSIHAKTTNIFFSALSIVNSMVGAGILVLPSATKDMGLFMMIIVIVFVALMNVISCDLLLVAAQISGQTSFTDLGYFVLGRSSIFIYGTLVCICFFLFITLYAQIFASSFESIFNTFGVSSPHAMSWYIIGIILLCLAEFLLILQKQIAEIKLASLFSFIAAISFALFLSMILFLDESQYKPEKLSRYVIRAPSFAMFAGISAFISAFGYQPIIYPAYLGLSHRTLKRGNMVNYLACLIVFFLYLYTSVIGLISYPSSVLSSDILTTISTQLPHWFKIFPNIVFLVIMAMHIPIMFFVLKESFLIMIDECVRRSTSNQKQFLEEGQKIEVLAYLSMNPLIYYLTTILLWLSSIGLALFRIPLKNLVNYLGAFGMGMISFVIPGIYYLLTLRKENKKGRRLQKCCAWFCLIFGIVSTVLLIITNILVSLGF